MKENEQNQKTSTSILNIKKYYHGMDGWLLAIVGLIIVFGLVMVYSSTMYLYEGSMLNPNPMSYLIKQVMGIGVGIFLFLGVASIPFKKLINFNNILFVSIGIVLALIFVQFFGEERNGARSWIAFGPFDLQPSEFGKLSIVLLWSSVIEFLNREQRQIHECLKVPRVATPSVIIGVSIILIFAQPDIGMFIMLLGLLFMMLIINTEGRLWNTFLYIIIAGAFAIVHLIGHVLGDFFMNQANPRWWRLGSFVNPFNDAKKAGFQLIGAYLAFSRGDWFGVGIGQGITKQTDLPAGHTDFILAVVGEELGLIGVIVLLGLIFAMIIRILVWAYRSQDYFRRSVLSGMGILFLLQVLINVGGIAGLIPLTGVTLPFVSYGGSSMMVSVLAIGIVQIFIMAEKRAAEQDLKGEGQYDISNG